MTKIKPLFLFILLLFLVFFGSFYAYYSYVVNSPASSDSKRQEVTIERGLSVRAISKRLGEAGLVKSPKIFELYVTFNNLSTSIQAGKYEVPKNLSVKELVEVLKRGTFDVKLTFLEGWRREEFADYASQKLLNFDKDRFLLDSQGLEGYLFPDTYVVPQDYSAVKLIELLTSTFDKKYAGLEQAGEKSGLAKSEIIILASIVEREMRDKADRPVIAGILVKRWKLGWSLGADATVQYALGKEGSWWPKELTSQDLQVDSKYNTRKYAGLPPGPICSPGFDAIEAVVNYEESPYWFYLSDKDGNTHFAKTLEEHNANVAKYLK